MTELTKEQRLEAARARTKQNIENKDSYGVKGKSVLDFDKIGGYKKEMFYRPIDGVNHIDFIPFVVKSDRHPDRVKPGTPEYVLELFVHRFVGAAKDSFVCLKSQYGKPCPICEAHDTLKLDPDATKEEVDALNPKKRVWFNVINCDSKDKNQPVQIFEENHFYFQKELMEFINNKNAFEFWDREFGKTLEFTATENKSPFGKHFKYKQFYLDDRQPYGEDIYEEAYNLVDLLHIPTYEEVRNSYLGVDDSEAPEEAPARQGGAEEAPHTRSRGPEAPARSRGRNIQDDIAEESEERFNKISEPSTPRTRTRERSTAEVAENPCTFGHRFGADNQKFPTDCTKCDQKLWDQCCDEYDKTVGATNDGKR